MFWPRYKAIVLFTFVALTAVPISTHASAFSFEAVGMSGEVSANGCYKSMSIIVSRKEYESLLDRRKFQLFLGGLVSAIRKECGSVDYVWLYLSEWDAIRGENAFYVIEVDTNGRADFSELDYAFRFFNNKTKPRDRWLELLGLELREDRGKGGWVVESVVPNSTGEKGGLVKGDVIKEQMGLPPLDPGTTIRLRIEHLGFWTHRSVYVPPSSDDDFNADKERIAYIERKTDKISRAERGPDYNPRSVLDIYGLHPPNSAWELFHEDQEFALFLRTFAREVTRQVCSDQSDVSSRGISTAHFQVVIKNFNTNQPLNKDYVRNKILPHIRSYCPQIIDFQLYVHIFPFVFKEASLSGQKYYVVLDASDPEYAGNLDDIKATNVVDSIIDLSIGLFGSAKELSGQAASLPGSKWFINSTNYKWRSSIRKHAGQLSKSSQKQLDIVLARRDKKEKHRQLDIEIAKAVRAYGSDLNMRWSLLGSGQLKALRRFEATQAFKKFTGSRTRNIIRHFSMVMGDKHYNCGKPTTIVDVTWNTVTEYYNMYGGYAGAPIFKQERYAGTFLSSVYDRLGSEAHVYINQTTSFVRGKLDNIGCGQELDRIEKNMIAYLSTPVP